MGSTHLKNPAAIKVDPTDSPTCPPLKPRGHCRGLLNRGESVAKAHIRACESGREREEEDVLAKREVRSKYEDECGRGGEGGFCDELIFLK